MTTEQQQLLKVALCGYYPNGLKVKTTKRVATSKGQKIGFAIGDLIGHSERTGYEVVFNEYDFAEDFDEVKPILFPISSLTKPIQLADYNNGEPFVPIVELLKIEHKQWWSEKKGTRYGEIEYKSTPNSAKACFSFMATKDITLYTLMPWNFPLWIIDLLNRWKIDYRDLIGQGLAVAVSDEFNPYK